MITQEISKKLFETLEEVFPKSPVKTNNKAGGGIYTATIVVKQLDNRQISTLDLIAKHLCHVEIKPMSDKEISIRFN